MVFSHLPSNVLLALDPACALARRRRRSCSSRGRLLSQMDVPARQAYVAALVDPAERTAAAGYTNAARHLVRPAGPGARLALDGDGRRAAIPRRRGLKAAYDVALYVTFRRVPLGDD